MKNKILSAILSGLIITSFAGCASAPPMESERPAKSMVTADAASDTEISDGNTAEPTPPDELYESDTESELPETQQTAEEKSQEEPAPEQTKPPMQTESQKPMEPTESQKPQELPAAQTQPPALPEPNPTPAELSKPTEPTVTIQPKEPEDTAPPTVIEPPKTFTQADHERIIKEVTDYAESYKAKGFIFEWKGSMEFGWDVGYFGTPRIGRDGIDGTIRTLKYHIDKIVSTSTDPANGITTEYMTYKVVQITIDGSIAYAVIYGG